jgi:hypothetical protein
VVRLPAAPKASFARSCSNTGEAAGATNVVVEAVVSAFYPLFVVLATPEQAARRVAMKYLDVAAKNFAVP